MLLNALNNSRKQGSWTTHREVRASFLAFGVVSAIADVCLASLHYRGGVSVC